MTPERLEEIREMVAEERDSEAFGAAAVHRRSLLAEVDRLRAVLKRIVERGDECNNRCHRGYAIGNCGCSIWSGNAAEEALEGTS